MISNYVKASLAIALLVSAGGLAESPWSILLGVAGVLLMAHLVNLASR